MTHPTVENVTAALNKAMDKAGVSCQVTLTLAEQRTEWLDAHSFVVDCQDDDVRDRAVQFVAKFCRRAAKRYYALGLPYDRYAPQYATHISGSKVEFCTFSAGD